MRLRIIALLTLLAQILLGFQGAAPVAATPQLAATFFSDDFEAGTLNPANWLVSNQGVGTVTVNGDAPHAGSNSVFIGQKTVGFTTTALILSINLANETDVFMDFWWRSVGFAGNINNGVYIRSNSGSTWTKIHDLNGDSLSYGHTLINVFRSASNNGVSLTSQFQIGFFFYTGNSNDTNSGVILDDVRLGSRAQGAAVFPFQRDTFEANDFGQGWYPESFGVGTVLLDPDYPHSGTTAVFIGQKRTGFATSSLTLAIDLSNQTDVFLDFWWRVVGFVGGNAQSAIFVSNDDGLSWISIRNLDNGSPSFSHELVNISDLALAKGVALNKSFQIKLSFGTSNSNDSNSGLIIDDVRLTSRAQELAAFPLPLDDFEIGSFQQGLYPNSLLTGATVIGTTSPHSGLNSVFIGQNTPGFASSALILAVDLSGQSSVFLDFWWRTLGVQADSGQNAVFISGDDGTTWKQIHTLSQASSSSIYTHEVINIASAALAQGVTLNTKFQLRISFNTSNSNASNSGLIIDDLRLGSVDPTAQLKVFLPLIRR